MAQMRSFPGFRDDKLSTCRLRCGVEATHGHRRSRYSSRLFEHSVEDEKAGTPKGVAVFCCAAHGAHEHIKETGAGLGPSPNSYTEPENIYSFRHSIAQSNHQSI